MRVLVTGHQGQLGQALLRHLSEHDVTGIDRPESDVTDAADVQRTFDDVQPELVIHAAALTDVDYCALHPEEALRVNAGGTENVALICREQEVPLLYVSTNEVFDGRATTPYQEHDIPNPINAYGRSKYEGERIVRQLLTRFYIVRTAWLYARTGSNFIHKVVAQARSGGALRVVDDEVSSPTYVEDLADAIVRLTENNRYGVYHLVNEGVASRYELAVEALRLAGLSEVAVEAISSQEFERPSTPPPYSPLKNQLAAIEGIRLRSWQSALAEFTPSLMAGK